MYCSKHMKLNSKKFTYLNLNKIAAVAARRPAGDTQRDEGRRAVGMSRLPQGQKAFEESPSSHWDQPPACPLQRGRKGMGLGLQTLLELAEEPARLGGYRLARLP